ncbi:MAG: adenine deaminase [Bacteroidales bacterium]|jgi:adenine deaminase|nr:adenine deaminase [Bacteroidales bacterium]
MNIFKGKIVDIVAGKIFKGELHIEGSKIKAIIPNDEITENQYLLPGLIDAHIHIESSMLIPSEFARLASIHGTVATVSDPHEIANVLGIDGVKFMIKNGKKVPFKFYFGAPSCVPATPFESSGASLGPDEIEELLQMTEIKYLAEMMNFPGVLNGDKEVMAKISSAKKHNKPVDGHAPGLKGKDAQKYVQAGISTDHECFTIEEALDKMKDGMFVQIREGSAAKNFESLIELIGEYSDKIMLCSDDKHPNDLENGHINQMIKRAIAKGFDLLSVLKSCTLNPVQHYKLDVGMLQLGDDADFIIIDNPKDFNVLKTFLRGQLIAENGKTLIDSVLEETPNIFVAEPLSVTDLIIEPKSGKLKIIEVIAGQLITKSILGDPLVKHNNVISDLKNDVLKIVVLNRYKPSKPSIGFIRGFGFKKGAIASSVAHDSHNIIAVGTTDAELVDAINLIITEAGGVSLVCDNEKIILPLPVAGIMSNNDGFDVAKKYAEIDKKAKTLGGSLEAPFMTLSFMALLVIPELKLSDKGLFDGNSFSFTELFDHTT